MPSVLFVPDGVCHTYTGRGGGGRMPFSPIVNNPIPSNEARVEWQTSARSDPVLVENSTS